MDDLNALTSTDGRPWASLSPSIVPMQPPPVRETRLTAADTYVPPPAPPAIANDGETCLAMAQRLARIRGVEALDETPWRQKLRWSAVPPDAMALDWEEGVLRVLMSCTPGGLVSGMP